MSTVTKKELIDRITESTQAKRALVISRLTLVAVTPGAG